MRRWSAARRWAIGLPLLAASVLTSIGHSIGTPEGFVDSTACRDNSLFARPEGDLQTGIAGAPLPATVGLPLFCRGLATGSERPTYQPVVWTVTSGGGRLNDLPEGAPLSQGVGVSAVEWHLGPTIGTQTLTATTEGLTVRFTATALPPGPGGTCADDPATTGGITFIDHRTVAGTLRLTAAGSPYRALHLTTSQGAEVHIEPGVHLCARGVMTIDGPLRAVGSADRPITLSAQSLSVYRYTPGSVQSATPTELRHVVGDGIRTLQVDAPATVADTVWRAPPLGSEPTCVTLALNTTGGVLDVQRSVFERYQGGVTSSCPGAVNLMTFLANEQPTGRFSGRVRDSAGTGVAVDGVAGRWTLQACEVTRSQGDGILVRTPNARIEGCNIVDNGGVGVRTLDRTTVARADARGNWWGDPAGPLAAGGDGVAGNVDAGGPLPAAVTLDY